MNSLKSLAINCGPLSEMMRGLACGYFSLAQRLAGLGLENAGNVPPAQDVRRGTLCQVRTALA